VSVRVCERERDRERERTVRLLVCQVLYVQRKIERESESECL
jgi:hypothetical protein